MMFVAWMFAQVAAAPTQPASGAAPTLQAQFEQASAALQARTPADALALFKAIEARPGISTRTRSVVLIRQGAALVELRRYDEAAEAYRKGLSLAPTADPTLREDRNVAWVGIAELAKRKLDYGASRRAYEAGLSVADDPTSKMKALVGIAAVSMFDDNKAALAAIDQAVEIANGAKVSRPVSATLHETRGRVLLNAGLKAEALSEFQLALRDQGGLTERTDLRDVMVRSDLALAYVLADKPDKALEYFEMTGQGRLPSGPFATGATTNLPPCGGDLQPTDRGVVEFGIGPEGAVSYATPVYASRAGPAAVELARAVGEWRWRPGDVAQIPEFYRLVTRVEVRCSLATERPADHQLLLPDVVHWLNAHGSPLDEGALSGSAQVARLETELAAAERAGATGVPIIGLLMAKGGSPDADLEDRGRAYFRALQLVAAHNPPPAVVAYLTLNTGGFTPSKPAGAGPLNIVAHDLLTQPAILADARTSTVLRLIVGSPAPGGDYAPDAEVALRQVIYDSRIADKDPLKVGAMVRLASFQAHTGQLDQARSTYLKTGLNAQQCSLVDAHPVVQKAGVGSNDYPMDMLKMQVSGWTRIEFDILSDGTTANRRAVASYPPFIFGDSTIKAMEKTRFSQTYRPNDTLGCGGASLQFRYIMPSS